MAEHDRAGLLPGEALEPRGDELARAAQSLCLADGGRFDERHVAVFRLRALGHDNDAEMGTERVARVNSRGDRVDVVRELREQDDVGAAADPGVEGDPPRIPSHHLDDHDAPVRLGGRVQAIDGVGGKGHRGIEPEAIGGADDVVVDRLRHADDWDAELAEPMRKAERAVAANHHEAAKSHAVKHLDDPVGVLLL